MSATKSAPILTVKRWLMARKRELKEIGPDTDLIEGRVIDSLGFIEFIHLLERVSGHAINLNAQSVNSFRTPRLVRDNILNRTRHE
ncbi:MAG: acyl carrier protein [Blastocatellia bacterium]